MTSDEGSENDELKVLLAEYEILREDERHWTVIMGSFAGIALLIAGFTLSLLFQPEWHDAVPNWAFLFVPMPLAVVLGYLFHLSAPMPVVSLYLRTLEQRLWEYTRPTDVPGDERLQIRHPSSHYLGHVIQSPRTGRMSIRFGQYIMYGFLAVLFAVIVLISLQSAVETDVTKPLIWVAGISYAAVTVWLLFDTISLAVRGRDLWMTALAGFADTCDKPLGRTEHEPSLASALLLPRKQELVKSLLPLGAGIWIVLMPNTPTVNRWEELLLVAAFVVVFELIFYQGRYLLNDLMDSGDDVQNLYRSRYPWHRDRRSSRLALLSLLIRLLMVAVVLVWGPDQLRSALAGAVTVAAVAAIVYDLGLRESTRRLTTEEWRRGTWRRSIYLWGGVGYAVRVAAPVWMLTGDPSGTLAAALFGLVLGSMFVTMTWGLESTTKPVRKAHVTALIPDPEPEHFSAFDKVLAYWDARGRMWDWFTAALMILAPAAALSMVFPTAPSAATWWSLAIIAVLAVVFGASLASPDSFRRFLEPVWPLIAFYGVIAIATGWVASVAGAWFVIWALFPLATAFVLYVSFRGTCYRDLIQSDLIVPAFGAKARCFADGVVGRMRQVSGSMAEVDASFATEMNDRQVCAFLDMSTTHLAGSERSAWVVHDDTTGEAISIAQRVTGNPNTDPVPRELWPQPVQDRWFDDYSMLRLKTVDGCEATHPHPISSLPRREIVQSIAAAVADDTSEHVLAFIPSGDDGAMCTLGAFGFIWLHAIKPGGRESPRIHLFGIDRSLADGQRHVDAQPAVRAGSATKA